MRCKKILNKKSMAHDSAQFATTFSQIFKKKQWNVRDQIWIENRGVRIVSATFQGQHFE
jgi:hypothetical protein